MNDLIKAKNTLTANGYTCVLCKGESIYTSTLRGVRPLVQWVESGADFSDYSAADKVIGKATAFLYVMLGVKAVYAGVISNSALQVLTKHGINTEFGIQVENIINRQGNGICPFESAVLQIEDKDTAYSVIKNKLNILSKTI